MPPSLSRFCSAEFSRRFDHSGQLLQNPPSPIFQFTSASSFVRSLDLDIFERSHGVLDVPAQLRADMACCELVELGADLLPAEWSGRKSGIIGHLVAERLTAFEPDGHAAGELGGKAGREALVRPYVTLRRRLWTSGFAIRSGLSCAV